MHPVCFFASLFGVNRLHHGGGAVGGVEGTAVGGTQPGIGGEDVGAAVLAAEYGTFGEDGKTA